MKLRNKTLIIGGLIGSGLGLLAAWLYVRAALSPEAQGLRTREERLASPQSVPAGKMVKLGLAVMEVLRQVTALGAGEEEEGQKQGKLRQR